MLNPAFLPDAAKAVLGPDHFIKQHKHSKNMFEVGLEDGPYCGSCLFDLREEDLGLDKIKQRLAKISYTRKPNCRINTGKPRVGG